MDGSEHGIDRLIFRYRWLALSYMQRYITLRVESALGLAVFATGRLRVWWHIAEVDEAALLVLHFDEVRKDDILSLTEFLGMNFAEDSHSLQVNERAMPFLWMNSLYGIAGSVVNDAVFDEQFAFDVMEVDWADYTMIDGDLSWCGMERMVLGFQAVRHERAMQDFEIQAAVDFELAVDQKAVELKVGAALFAAHNQRAMNYWSHAVGGFDYQVGVFGQVDGEVALIEAVVHNMDGIMRSICLDIVVTVMLLYPGAKRGFPLFQCLLEGTDFSTFQHIDTLSRSGSWE